MQAEAFTQMPRSSAASPATDDAAQGGGWYFYGITLSGLPEPLLSADPEDDVGAGPTTASGTVAPLQLVELSGLAAVVRPVRLDEFSRQALQERMQDAAAMELMVRSHNRVIESIHARQAILPAKFGVVYALAEDVVSALRSGHDTLVQQLHRIQGCEEWAIHLYADRDAVRERITTENLAIRRRREEQASSRPGRAYFLEQQLRAELESVTEQALSTLADTIFEQLAQHAVAAELNSPGSDAMRGDEVEILRASFLVSRERTEQFTELLRSNPLGFEGLRCEYSGPWPPYSFAAENDAEIGAGTE